MTVTARQRSGSFMIKAGAGLPVLGGVAHIPITLWETAPRYAGAWLRRELWQTSS